MNRWNELETSRRAWSFLVVDEVEKEGGRLYAAAWALGDGNADHFLGSNQYEVTDVDGEEELLVGLGKALDTRRYQDSTLITPTQKTLSFLRARFLTTDAISQPTFRGFRHIALDELLSEYVETSAINDHKVDFAEDGFDWQTDENRVDGESVVKSLWELRAELGPLVPEDALYGSQL
ncbi:hypothetical protein [Halovenus sp. HT40]|uniref:hypothetical protein n=1 Tax=Halovenus sp. HT40 TaxID=3126691 RepID=UPI00300EF075